MSTPLPVPPNPAVAAFFRSTTWRLLWLADVLAIAIGVGGYVYFHTYLSFIPFGIVAVILGVTMFRVGRMAGAAPPPDTGDPLVK